LVAPAKVLVLGVDAANPALLGRWASDGTLPALGALLRRSRVARSRGVEGFFVGSTWPSLATGVGPAGHGIHYLNQLRVGTYSYERVADRSENVEPFWVRVSRAGRRVAVLDVPLSRLAEQLNGIQTVEWGSHDALYGFRAAPEALQREIVAAFGMHPQTGSCDARRTTVDEYQELIERLTRGVSVKGRLTRELLLRGGWDLFVQVFTEAHCAGHQCWHLHDPEHPSHDSRIVSATADPLRRVCQAIDAAIGEVLAAAGDAVVVLIVPHGMSHSYGAHFLLQEILFSLGVAFRPGDAAARTPSPGLPALGVEPEASDCFAVRNGLTVGGIRLNLAGREPAGRLERGAEADRFCERLSADLRAIVNADTGRPLVRRVLRTSELFQGRRLDELPDLLVEWSDEGPLANTSVGPADAAAVRATSPKIGLIEGVNNWGRTGEHRKDGLIAISAPGARAGKLNDVDLVDVAPTVMGLLGVEHPGLDGRAVTGLLP
jgi:predicted AlkP superfamily phosphohydrolase/phosphomutase